MKFKAPILHFFSPERLASRAAVSRPRYEGKLREVVWWCDGLGQVNYKERGGRRGGGGEGRGDCCCCNSQINTKLREVRFVAASSQNQGKPEILFSNLLRGLKKFTNLILLISDLVILDLIKFVKNDLLLPVYTLTRFSPKLLSIKLSK